MHYIVTARLKEDQAAEFLRRLMDGTIEAQEPDGEEIVESMHRARIDSNGTVHWSEVCYCPTPLAHERETVYDRFFDDIQTHEADAYVEFKGDPLMDRLTQLED